MSSNPNEKIQSLQITEESNLSGNDASTASIMVASASRGATCDSRNNLINDEAHSEDASKAALGRSSPPSRGNVKLPLSYRRVILGKE